ncbi:MAG: hypothetical protein C4347_02245 [Patescibacteria group bacterium]
MIGLKNFIFQKIKNYNFQTLKIKETNLDFLNWLKKQSLKEINENEKFISLLQKIEKNELANFIFILRSLDFRLWEFKNNWQYKNQKGFYGLLERTKELFLKNYRNIDFQTFKKIISPKEKIGLAKLRYQIFKEALNFLKSYDNDFNNYFEENKKPLNFCLKLCKLRKFKDYYKNFYFLKPNQLLYYELILAKNLTKKYENELSELTVFADYKLPQLFLNFNLIVPSKIYFQKIKKRKIIKSKSLFEIELRMATIILGEEISQKIKIPSYKLDTILWSIANKLKMKIPEPLVKTIYY